MFVGGDHGGNGGAGRVVEVMMNELADVATGATPQDDNAGGECEEESVGEGDGLAEIVPAIGWSARQERRNEEVRRMSGGGERTEGVLGEIEPCLGCSGIAGEVIREAGVFGELDVQRGALKDLAGADEAFGGGGAGNDGEQSVGGIGLKNGRAEEREPPVFEIESLGET